MTILIKVTSQEEYGLIEFSLKYPFTNQESKFGGAISCVAGLLTVFTIFPIVLVAGYASKMRESVINKESEAPKFEHYGELYKEGKGSIIAQAPVYFIAVIGLLSSLIIQPPILLGLIYLAYLMNPIVKVRYAVEDSYKSVYDGKILEALFDESYIKYHSIYTLLIIIIASLSISLGMFTLGLGFVASIALLIVVRPVYWGYTYENNLSHIF